MSQEIRLKKIDETTNYFLEEIKQNDLTSRKHKKSLYNSKLYSTLSYFSFTVTGYITLSAFDFLLGIPVEITSSAIGLKVCAIATG